MMTDCSPHPKEVRRDYLHRALVIVERQTTFSAKHFRKTSEGQPVVYVLHVLRERDEVVLCERNCISSSALEDVFPFFVWVHIFLKPLSL